MSGRSAPRGRAPVAVAVVGALVLAGGSACGRDAGAPTGTVASPAAAQAPAAGAPTPVPVTPPASPTAGPKAGPSTTAPPKAAAAGPRDRFVWPFSAKSPWNTPIGSGARYVKVPIGSTGIGVDTVHIHRVKASDPVVPSYDANAFVGVRCAGSKRQQQSQWHAGLDTVRIPAGLLFPDANLDPGRYFTPNGKLALLMPDGRTVRYFQPACRQRKGGPLYGYAFPPQDIHGDGRCCAHGGSGLSAMGGTLRKGELTGAEPIRHALAVNLWGTYLHFDRGAGKGHVWPATTQDGAAASTYRGSDANLTMGSLLAIPPSVTERSLALETAAGRRLFHAMRDYGAYVVDDSGQDSQDLNMEKSAEDELVRTVTGGRPVHRYGPLSRDFTKLMRQARVVVNNGPSTVGGGGRPRAPLAPKIRD